MKEVKEAVTFAASLLAMLKTSKGLDAIDRQSCEQVQRMLEEAERILYGREEKFPR